MTKLGTKSPYYKNLILRIELICELSEMINSAYFNRYEKDGFGNVDFLKNQDLEKDRQFVQDQLQGYLEQLARQFYLNAKG